MKKFTLRKISTGGILITKGTSITAIIKKRGLDPTDWEQVKATPESEDEPIGDNQGDGGTENN